MIEGFLRNKFPKLRFLETLPDAIKLPGGETFALNPSPADPARNTMIAGPEREDVATDQGGFINVANPAQPTGIEPSGGRGGVLDPTEVFGDGTGAQPSDGGIQAMNEPPLAPSPANADDPSSPATPPTAAVEEMAQLRPSMEPLDFTEERPQNSSPGGPDRGFESGDNVGNLRTIVQNQDGEIERTTIYPLTTVHGAQSNASLGRGSIDSGNGTGKGTGPLTYSQSDRDAADEAVRFGIWENRETLRTLAPIFIDGSDANIVEFLGEFPPDGSAPLFATGVPPEDVAGHLEDIFGFQYTIGRDQDNNVIVSFAEMNPDDVTDLVIAARQHPEVFGMQIAGPPGATPNNAFAVFVVEIAKKIAARDGVGILVTGHSLGGGLGAAAALANNVPAFTFSSIETIQQLPQIESSLSGLLAPGSLTSPEDLSQARASMFNAVHSSDEIVTAERPALQTVEIMQSDLKASAAHALAGYADAMSDFSSVTLTTQQRPRAQ